MFKKSHNQCTVDELRRVLLSQALREQLGWTPNMALSVMVTTAHVEFYAQEGGAFPLDDFNRVTITHDIMEAMDWNVCDKVQIEVCQEKKCIALFKTA